MPVKCAKQESYYKSYKRGSHLRTKNGLQESIKLKTTSWISKSGKQINMSIRNSKSRKARKTWKSISTLRTNKSEKSWIDPIEMKNLLNME